MRFTKSGLTLLSLALTAHAQGSYDRRQIGVNRANNTIIPGRYIVEFNKDELQRKVPDGTLVDAFYKSLDEQGLSVTPGLNISSSIFEGASFTINENTKVEDIGALAEVSMIWPVRVVPRPDPRIDEIGPTTQPMWSSHTNTGVLALHSQGILGEGATVAIVDTGIDYTHPSLGGGFGTGYKVEGGIDIVGDDYLGIELSPDSDPYDCVGHGTHVAGIVAGDDAKFVGVAPRAKLRAYKVFGCSWYQSTGDDALILAFVTAYEDGADVINASIGGPGGYPEDAWAAAASRLVDRGVFIAISAGNSGSLGIWFPSSGSSGTEVVAVASIDTEQLFGFDSTVELGDGTNRSVAYLDGTFQGFDLNRTLPIYPISLDKTIANDACDALPDDTPDLSSYLVLIRQGGCAFAVKEQNAVAHGAQYIWFYNTPGSPTIYPSIENPVGQGYAMITASDGEFIIDNIAAGGKVDVTFPPEKNTSGVNNTLSGGKISTYSSWGPTYEAQIKPDIAAPGGQIFSTYPVEFGSYAVLSGTSMASPYIAGIAALYIGAKGGRDNLGPEGIKELKSRIITSGNLVNFNNGSVTDWSIFAPVAQQGGGYVNAQKVVTYDTTVFPPKLELNDTAHFQGAQNIDVINNGEEKIVYIVTHEPAATVNSFESGSKTPQFWPPTFINSTATAEISVSKFTVEPGLQGSFNVTITPPDVDPTLLPVYSGKIVITASNGEIVSIPYQGILGNLFDVDIWDISQGYPHVADDKTGAAITGPQSFTLQGYDRPAGVFINNFGTAEMRFDVVEENWSPEDWQYPPVPGEKNYVGSIISIDPLQFPLKYVPRTASYNSYYFPWAGNLTDRTIIQPGTYKINFRALRVSGSPERELDWQSVLSPAITILPETSNSTKRWTSA